MTHERALWLRPCFNFHFPNTVPSQNANHSSVSGVKVGSLNLKNDAISSAIKGNLLFPYKEKSRSLALFIYMEINYEQGA